MVFKLFFSRSYTGKKNLLWSTSQDFRNVSEACGWKLAFSDLLVSCSLGKDETMRPSLRQCPGYVLDSADDVIET